ncbi:cytochrome P450 [Amycolatopsis minnesotensis]|uniref:Cytochrome P450 n=1 Tax=Amycolatopsis minnesotensis TaxID=337894 RepID=A0ABN2QL53_9PSEU
MRPAALPPRFDPREPEVVENPYPTYARLRAAGPLCRSGAGSWAVTRHADVLRLQRDPRLGSQFPEHYHRLSAGDGAASAFFQRIMLYRDPPEHLRLRKLMGKAFSPAMVRRMRADIEAITDELLAPALDGGGLDVVPELAYPLPVRVICRLMGIPEESTDEVRRFAIDLGRAFAAIVPDEARAAADTAVGWLRERIGALLAERRRHPREDLISRLLAVEDAGEALTHSEIVDNTVFSFFAGFETTVHLITTGWAALLDHPAERARLLDRPGLAATAVEEFLRYDAPIQGTARYLNAPVEIEGRKLRAGRVLILLLGSANHDESVFDDPAALDIGRTPNPHVTFGGGAHLCLGAFLARMEGTIVFERLASRVREFSAAGPAHRQANTPFRAYATVPVALSPR